jgi:uncharacterized membrane protein
MIEITLYTREDCHMCDELKQMLLALEDEIPHKLNKVNVDTNSALKKKFGESIPVLVVGPYTLKAPIERSDLEITLRAAHQRAAQISEIEAGIASGSIQVNLPWSRSDAITLWFSRKWLAVFNFFILLYVGLPFLAPVLMKAGASSAAELIYRTYGIVCHQFAYRSWFLFGEQPFYPREEAHMDEVIPFTQATGVDPTDLWAAREYQGDNEVGFKVALCQRDVAIYLGILLFGLIFVVTQHRMIKIPWYLWILFGIVPIGLDGLSQIISQPPLNLIAFRESTPLLRTITGFLFGYMTAWFSYPMAEESMRESREYLTAKLKRIKSQQQA